MIANTLFLVFSSIIMYKKKMVNLIDFIINETGKKIILIVQFNIESSLVEKSHLQIQASTY